MTDGTNGKVEPDNASTTQKPVNLASGKAMLFYHQGKISTRISEQGNHRILWAQEIPTAQSEPTQVVSFLNIDYNNSVLGMPGSCKKYTPYGYVKQEQSTPFLGFNGQWLDSSTEGYALGNGYRLYNPALLRFHSPDELSPFDRGGINCYAYCEGDPTNNTDPTGHSILKGFKNFFGGRRAKKLERIEYRNIKAKEHNRLNNLFDERPNLNKDGTVNLKNLLENDDYYSTYVTSKFKDPLKKKDMEYAKKYDLLTPTNQHSQRAETFELASKHKKNLSKLARAVERQHNEELEAILPGNPIDTRHNFLSPTRIRGEQS
ncbi:RHS repeat-associated core domain-containing protein [Pseudomonas sp. NPDC089392]|uniref:RHS repeat-associated core domain-containing protein n=1 Tax=Pseudomonas sp. NPDC089392 TaxID=3364459 RepID=UPI0038111057